MPRFASYWLRRCMPGNRVILPHLLSLSIVSWACSRRSDSAGRKEIKNGEKKKKRMRRRGRKQNGLFFHPPLPPRCLFAAHWVLLGVSWCCGVASFSDFPTFLKFCMKSHNWWLHQGTTPRNYSSLQTVPNGSAPSSNPLPFYIPLLTEEVPLSYTSMNK